MRASRAYIASAGTAGVMLAAAVSALLVVSAFIAFGSWPGSESAKHVDELLLKDVAKPAAAKTVEVTPDAVQVARKAELHKAVAERRSGRTNRTRAAVPGAKTPAGTTPATTGTPTQGGQTPAGNTVAGVQQQTQDVTRQVSQNLQQTTQNVGSTVQQTTDQVTTQVNQVVDQVVGGVQQTTDTVGTTVQQTTQSVDTTVQQVGNTVTGATGGLLGK